MMDAASQGEYIRFRKNLSRLGDLPMVRYLKWSRHTKGAYKNMWKGLLKSLKGIAYILVLLYSLDDIPHIPLGMGVLIILIGLKGVFNLARGIHLSLKARRLAVRSRGERGERRWRYFLLWTNFSILIAIISLSFLFIIEHIKAPQEIRGDQPWYIWPLIYLAIWTIWSIATRSMVLGGARAFRVGDRLAKVHHDNKLLKEVLGQKRQRRILLASGYFPIIGLGLMVFLIILMKMLLRFLLKIVFDIDLATTIGEEMTRLAFGSGLSLTELSSIFGTWYGPLLLYLGVVFLIGIFAYIRSFAMIRTQFREKYHSHLGKRVKLASELKRVWK